MGREEMGGRRKEGEWEVLIIEGLKHEGQPRSCPGGKGFPNVTRDGSSVGFGVRKNLRYMVSTYVLYL